jgi:hypothetical protein
MRVTAYDISVPLDALVRDVRAATRGWDWRRGAYGHALSLPFAHDLHPYARYRYPNMPCTGRLDACPALRAIFESFPCEKMSFRLLRRPAHSAYGWHTDEWKGRGVVRFQIPIIADASAFLVTTDLRRVEDLRGDRRPLQPQRYDECARENRGHVMRHELTPGRLYYFDTTYVHTLVNGGGRERITLSFDLIANDWLRAAYPAIVDEIGGDAATLPARPGRVRLAADWLVAQAFPLRTWAAWRRQRAPGGPS